ncbi:aspartate/glutamate racemase family protein [Microbacterium gilvum]|uniref:Aspartate/glutamate racemase family protein n=1 Tax=Microbacterium gilvum TaxID=1336204 RepID=A0ABP9AQ69_9MICO
MPGAPLALLIVNPNTNDDTTRLLVATAGEAAGPGVEVAGATAAHGPRMITDPQALAAAAPHVARAAVEAMRRRRVDAIVIGAYGDPGLVETAAATGVPVVGIGGASVQAAARGGRRFAIATTTGRLTGALHDLVERNGLLDRYIGCYLTASPAERLDDAERLVDELRTACRRAQADGAEAVVIGGGPLSAAAETLTRELGDELPIIEPVKEAVATALAALVPSAI